MVIGMDIYRLWKVSYKIIPRTLIIGVVVYFLLEVSDYVYVFKFSTPHLISELVAIAHVWNFCI